MMLLQQAREITDGLVETLRPLCTRIEIAGSIRREKSEPKDIEIVCMPLITGPKDLFGNIYNPTDHLERFFDTDALGIVKKNGPKYKQITLFQGINLDLFVVREPAQWGVIFAIRTGPADFSHWLVTSHDKGGALPDRCRIADGQLWEECTRVKDEEIGDWILTGGNPVRMPEEKDLFDYLGLPMIEPKERSPMWWGRVK